MRVDQTTFAAYRAALLQAAGRLLLGRGLGISVAEVSRAAGLTHGAVYGHFASKDALVAAACRSRMLQGAAKWRGRAAAVPEDRMGAIIDGYLTEAHRDDPASGGCILAALGPEATRNGGAVAEALGVGARAMLTVLSEELGHLPAAPDPEAAHRVALGILGALVGGIMVARALKPDPAASTEALLAARGAARQLIPASPARANQPSRSG